MIYRLLPTLLSSAVLSIVVLVLALMFECFPKAISARSRYAAWIVLLAGFTLPFRPVFLGGAVNVALLPQYGVPAGTLLGQSGIIAEIVPNQFAQAPAHSLLVILWLLGALLFFAYYTAKHIRFTRFIKRWSTDDVAGETVILHKVLKERSIKNVGLKKCDLLSTSVLVGFFKPTIILPGNDFDENELELIFRHELVHYRRRDLLVKFLSMVVVSVHWFNPAVYVLSASMQADLEASCDEAVLAQTGVLVKFSYAELIIAMIGTKKQFASPISTCFYGSKRSVKKRMGGIMEFTGKLGKPNMLVMLSLFALTVLSGSVFSLSERERSVIQEVPAAFEGQFTSEDAVKLALQLIQGGVITDVLADGSGGFFRIEVVRDTNLYLLSVTKDGIVTLDQTISIYEIYGHNRRRRMSGR